MVAAQPGSAPFTTEFGLRPNDTLLPTGGNRYFPLYPGGFSRFEGEDDNQAVTVEVRVLNQTKTVRFQLHGRSMAVQTRVIEEREWVEGELSQVSLNYFAWCPKTGNVYNFGEDVSHYVNGQVVGHEDTWLAGRNGAKPGLQMPGTFLLGSRYHMELASGVSMDRAENVGSGRTVQTPLGTIRGCITVLETTPLEPDEEVLKAYAPGIGLVADGDLKLVATNH